MWVWYLETDLLQRPTAKKKDVNSRIFKIIFTRYNKSAIYTKIFITFYVQIVVTYAYHFSLAGKRR